MNNFAMRVTGLLALGAVLFGAGIATYDLWPADEPRFAQVAREMMESGDYLAPHVNAQPYREKPPLLFWAIAAVSFPFGDVTEFSARVPSVIAAVLTLLCTILLAQKLYGGQVALWSALILATTTRFWWQARTVQIDMLLCLCLTAAFYFLWSWNKDRRTRDLVVAYLLIALAILAKGPPGLVFPLLFIWTFYWGRKEDRRATHWFLGCAASIAMVCLWLIPARLSVGSSTDVSVDSAITDNLFRQTIGRFILGVSHAQAPWYYLETLPVDLLPWALFLPYVVYYTWKRRKEGEEMRFLLAWILPALLFFSLSAGKRALYLLPLFPPISILMARAILDLSQAERHVWRQRTAFAWAFLLLAVALAIPAIRFTDYAEAWSPRLLVLSAALGVFGVHAITVAIRSRGGGLHRAMAVHVVVLQLLVVFTAFPALNPYKSAREFCAPLAKLSDAKTPYELYTIGFSREAYIFYARHAHVPLLITTLDIEIPGTETDQEVAELQYRLRKNLTRAVEDISIASFSELSAAEGADLLRAAGEVLTDESQARAFREGIAQELRPLEEATEAGVPAFAIVQEEDYRWVLPLAPLLARYDVLHGASVGSRNVLLLANEAGARLIGM